MRGWILVPANKEDEEESGGRENAPRYSDIDCLPLSWLLHCDVGRPQIGPTAAQRGTSLSPPESPR